MPGTAIRQPGAIPRSPVAVATVMMSSLVLWPSACKTTGSAVRPDVDLGSPCALIVTDDDILSGSATAGAMYVEEAREGRRLLTADVLAVAEGFLAGGVACVDVIDSHDGAIDPRPLKRIGVPVLTPSNSEDWVWPFLGPMRRPYSMAALMGFHSNAGQQGFRPHTINDSIRGLWIDDRASGEISHMTVGLSAFDVPVVLVHGDMNATAEGASWVPDVEQVTVRWLEPDGTTGFLGSEEAARQLGEAAERAASGTHEAIHLAGPMSIRLETWSAELMRDRSADLATGYRAFLEEDRALLEGHPLGSQMLESGVLSQGPQVLGRGAIWQAESPLTAFASIAFAAHHLRGSGDGWAKVTEGYQAWRAGKTDKALAAYANAIERNPYDVATRCRMAAVYEELGDLDEARHLYRYGVERLEAVGDDPMKVWCLSGLAEVELASGHLRAARSAALQLAALPSSADNRQRIEELLDGAITPSPMPADAGLEGFYPVESITPRFVQQRELPVDSATVQAVRSRVGKLVIDNGEQLRPEEEILDEWEAYCGLPHRRLFNGIKCRAYEERSCGPEGCRYTDYGNCSGLFLGPGQFVTAAHCVQSMSRIVHFQWDGDRWSATEYEPLEVVALKRSWEDAWVIVEPEATDHIDVALVRFEQPDGTTEVVLPAPPPAEGEPLFVIGFPRNLTRPEPAMDEAGYGTVHGEMAVSLGRVTDANEADAPLCSTTGRQDDWRIRADCEAATGEDEDGDPVPVGLITDGPFLSNIDTINGYSGAPVFDAQGRWVGITCTIYGADPREAYVPAATPVQIKSTSAILSLVEVGALE